VRPDVLRWPGINRSAAGGGHGDQKVSQTDGVLLDKAEFPQAIMAGGALACVNDAFAFDVVLQYLGVVHWTSGPPEQVEIAVATVVARARKDFRHGATPAVCVTDDEMLRVYGE
jgi:hypothetical protein